MVSAEVHPAQYGMLVDFEELGWRGKMYVFNMRDTVE